MIHMHPRRIAEFRAAGLPVAGIPNFRCKCCGRSIYKFQGRKRVHQGWKCADCAVSVPTTETKTAASSVR